MIGWFFRIPSLKEPVHLITVLLVVLFLWWGFYHQAQAWSILGSIGHGIGSLFSHVNQGVKSFNPKATP